MAYDFLGLTNDVLTAVNQVNLTSANFDGAGATGFYADAKSAVNRAIREINRSEPRWPFNHVIYDETLVAGQARYDYQADAKSVDFNNFRIRENATFGNDTYRLRVLTYEDYVNRYVEDEYDTDTGIRDVPRFVARAQSNNYVVNPIPDNAYTLTYEYFRLPTDLSAATDVPSVPEAFRYVIFEGAMKHVHRFRGDVEMHDRAAAEFREGIKQMRITYINRFEYMRDTRVDHRFTSRYLVAADV